MRNIRIHGKLDPVKKAALISVIDQLQGKSTSQKTDSTKYSKTDWRSLSRTRKKPL
jgi:hypothetical protein